MAKGFGGPSKFIVSNVKKHAAIYTVAFITPIVGMFFVYILSIQLYAHKNTGIIFLFMLVYGLALLLLLQLFKYTFHTDTFIMGGNGEADIRDVLDKLPDNYSYYRGIKIDQTDFDVDFVVVGPTGIFAIDAKSYSGSISYKNGFLTKNGQEIKKNVLGQTKSEALFVHNLILENFKSDIFVTPVLAFSSWRAKMHFGQKPIDGVVVIKKKWLLDLITNRPNYQYSLDRRLIEQKLKSLAEVQK